MVGGSLRPGRSETTSPRAVSRRSVAPKVKLRFGDAAAAWLDGPVLDLRDTTQANYGCMVREHLDPRFEPRTLESLSADDMAKLVRDLRAEGKSEATIAVILGVIGHVYKFAARRLGWTGTIPTALMLKSERPKISQGKRRPIFTGQELEQTISAANEPFRTLFVVAALTGARISELCGLTWADVRLANPDDAEIEFGYQVDRHGEHGRPRPTDRPARCRSRPSLPRFSGGTNGPPATPHQAITCSQLVAGGRYSNGTSPGRYARRNGAP